MITLRFQPTRKLPDLTLTAKTLDTPIGLESKALPALSFQPQAGAADVLFMPAQPVQPLTFTARGTNQVVFVQPTQELALQFAPVLRGEKGDKGETIYTGDLAFHWTSNQW